MSILDRVFGPDITPAVLVASFTGAAAAAVVLKVRDPRQIAALLFIGFACSIYIGPLMGAQLSAWFGPNSTEAVKNASSFICGMSGMVIANGIIALVSKFVNSKAAS